jgi:signal transduction histidine kinase
MWVLAAMLGTLHLAIVSPFGSGTQLGLLIAHTGVFLLWQPFVHREKTLRVATFVVLAAVMALALARFAPWMLVAWLTLLTGILGGKVVTAGERNWSFMFALVYLLTILLAWVVPVPLLGITPLPGLPVLAQVYLPLLIVLVPFFKPAKGETAPLIFDFFYAVLAFQLVVVLVLGSIAIMRFTGDQYYMAVFITVATFGAGLSLLALIWNPGRLLGGFAGLRLYFSRYVMSVGMPFEVWMRNIASHADNERDPGEFLARAMTEIAGLPWVAHVAWRAPDGDGERGTRSPQDARTPNNHATLQHQSLTLDLHTRLPLAPALQLHTRLLAQVVGEFYEAKRRERALRINAYLHAVHATGAEMTHEVKNILQSMQTLTSAGTDLSEARERDFLALLKRTLPQLSARLGTTLERLRSPDMPEDQDSAPLSEWWQSLQGRLAGEAECVGHATESTAVPRALLDTAIDNLLQNARAKGAQVKVTVTLEQSAERIVVGVTDNGGAIPPAVARRLLQTPVERSDGQGFGIGLYQTAQQAERAGWRMALAENRDGEVRFTLARQSAGA